MAGGYSRVARRRWPSEDPDQQPACGHQVDSRVPAMERQVEADEALDDVLGHVRWTTLGKVLGPGESCGHVNGVPQGHGRHSEDLRSKGPIDARREQIRQERGCSDHHLAQDPCGVPAGDVLIPVERQEERLQLGAAASGSAR